MPNTTNRVKLPYILQSQSQKEVTHNASLDLIDALLQAAMVSVGVNTPPGSPNAGDSYIVGSAPTGAWAGQAKFDDFVEVYNHQRPHQGIANHYPAELYTPSTKIYRGLPEVDYPFADKTVTITHCGRTCMGNKKINVTSVLYSFEKLILQMSIKIDAISGGMIRLALLGSPFGRFAFCGFSARSARRSQRNEKIGVYGYFFT